MGGCVLRARVAITGLALRTLRGVRGLRDPSPLDKVTSCERKLRDESKASGQDILETIRTEKEISEATEEKLKAFLENFSKTFV